MYNPTEDGAVYTWGRGDDGRLGHGDNGWKYVPRVVEALEGQRIVQVGYKSVCGSYPSMQVASTSSKRVWFVDGAQLYGDWSTCFHILLLFACRVEFYNGSLRSTPTLPCERLHTFLETDAAARFQRVPFLPAVAIPGGDAACFNKNIRL